MSLEFGRGGGARYPSRLYFLDRRFWSLVRFGTSSADSGRLTYQSAGTDYSRAGCRRSH